MKERVRPSIYGPFLKKLAAAKHGDGPVYFVPPTIRGDAGNLRARVRTAIDRAGIKPPRGCRFSLSTCEGGVAALVVRE